MVASKLLATTCQGPAHRVFGGPVNSLFSSHPPTHGQSATYPLIEMQRGSCRATHPGLQKSQHKGWHAAHSLYHQLGTTSIAEDLTLATRLAEMEIACSKNARWPKSHSLHTSPRADCCVAVSRCPRMLHHARPDHTFVCPYPMCTCYLSGHPSKPPSLGLSPHGNIYLNYNIDWKES